MFKGTAWRAVAAGEPADVLRLEEMSWSEPDEGRLIVKVIVSGVSLPDLHTTRGMYVVTPPAVIGTEVSGEVVAVPKRSRFSVGDRVMGVTPFLQGMGGHAEYSYLKEGETRLIPAQLSDEQAAGFVIGFRTAHVALVYRCALKSGETLVVLGAAGSTGIATIQLGKALGATVIAVASNAEKLAYCASLGADHTIDYTTASVGDEIKKITGGHGCDVIFDPVGGEVATQAVQAIARYGRHAIVGGASGSFIALNPIDMLQRSYSAVGLAADGKYTEEEENAAYGLLFDFVEKGVIKAPVAHVMPFDEVPAAIARLDAAPPGKTVIRVS
jgi:NADPH2:quinone reductase